MKKINNYENYLIYPNGDVKNLTTNKMLKGSISENGYKYYRLSKDNKKKMFYAHRLVAEHYLENPNSLPVVNHKDGDKLNNNVNNLEWVTYSENVKHAHQNNLITKPSSYLVYEKDLDGEIWKQYLDYEQYLISNLGRVRNVNTNRILKPSLSNGYYKVRLCKNGKTQDLLVHKLVYCLFKGEEYLKDKNFVIDHIDANKLNNAFDNLRKLTNSENTLAALYEQKTNRTLKPVIQWTLEGEYIQDFPSCSEAARQLGLDSSTISKVCRGINQTHGGFKFTYK